MPGIRTILATPIVVLCLVLGACAHPDARAGGASHVAAAGDNAGMSAQADPENFEAQAREVFGTKALARADLPDRSLDSDLLYKFLLAEIAGQRGDYQIAAKAYLDMAKTTRDPRIARRATEVALYGRYSDMAVEAAKLWLETEKDSAAARQTLAALYVNGNDLQSAKPLLQQMLAADGDNFGQALGQLYPLLAKHADKNAMLAFKLRTCSAKCVHCAFIAFTPSPRVEARKPHSILSCLKITPRAIVTDRSPESEPIFGGRFIPLELPFV